MGNRLLKTGEVYDSPLRPAEMEKTLKGLRYLIHGVKKNEDIKEPKELTKEQIECNLIGANNYWTQTKDNWIGKNGEIIKIIY